jgi:hypothetical protein
VNTILHQMDDTIPPDPRDHKVLRIPALRRTLADLGATVEIESVTPESVAAAKAAQDADRRDAVAKLLPDAARELEREQLRDTVTAGRIANVILAADAEERGLPARTLTDFPTNARRDLLHDCAVSVRLRRPVWRRVSQARAQDAIYDGLREYASHLFADHYGPTKAEGAMRSLAAHLAGPVSVSTLESLSGRITVTAREFAQALLKCGGE